jgi:uncharacterized protein YjiS (DUF1127 family)
MYDTSINKMNEDESSQKWNSEMRNVLSQSQSQCSAQCQPSVLAQNLSTPRFSLGSVVQALSLLRSRQALAALSEEQLNDVGITASEARVEAARPIWDAPASWKS